MEAEPSVRDLPRLEPRPRLVALRDHEDSGGSWSAQRFAIMEGKLSVPGQIINLPDLMIGEYA